MTHITDFTESLERSGRSANTIAAYRRDVEVYIRWFEQTARQGFHPSLLTGRDLRAWREHSLNVEKVEGTTWNRRRASMRVYTLWALRVGLVAADPFEGIQPAEIQDSPIMWLDDNQFNRVLRHLEQAINAANTDSRRIQAIRNRAIVALMVFAGLRESEVCNLRRADVVLTERKGSVKIRNGKGSKFAEIPLNHEAVTDIRAWLTVQPCAPDDTLFTGKGTDTLTPRQVQRIVHAIGIACGIDGLHPHRFRHTFCKRTLDGKYSRNGAPVSLDVVARLARHSRIETTRRYTQPSADDLAAALGA